MRQGDLFGGVAGNWVDQLIPRIEPKYKPVWEHCPRDHREPLARYFLALRSKKDLLPLTKRVIAWYCPFADQNGFPSGFRYCINTYVGCAHECLYCYAVSYQPSKPDEEYEDPQGKYEKQGFKKSLDKDLRHLREYGMPPAPVHISNSTDPFQPLERRLGHTRYALEGLLAHRHHFTTITLLTKNPLLPVQSGYLELFEQLGELSVNHPARSRFSSDGLPPFQVEVSLAFFRDEARAFYDPCAPPVEARIRGIRELREAGIPVVIRIDPLFPRSPLGPNGRKTMADFDLPEAQTHADLVALVDLAREVRARHVVYSPAKIIQPRRRKMLDQMQHLKRAYQLVCAGSKLDWQGGSFRLPRPIAQKLLVEPLLEICSRAGVRAKYCKENLIGTP